MSDDQQGNKPGRPQTQGSARKFQAVNLFRAKDIAHSLAEVAVDLIKSEDRNIESRWFHSPMDADLFFWRDDQKNIIKQQMTFYGQLVEWNVVEGVRTGVIIEDEGRAQRGGTPMIRFDTQLQKHTVDQGVSIIENMTVLRPEDKSLLLSNFVRGPKLLSLGVEEIIKKYGNYMAQPGTTWFQRLLTAIGFRKK